jgi:carbamoyltransferase
MILAYKVSDDTARTVPAVVHVDGTVRPHTVKREVNPRYWKLIKEFETITGVPVILNTSFNVRGEPIICSPGDALRCFYGTGLDALAIGDYLLTKPGKS